LKDWGFSVGFFWTRVERSGSCDGKILNKNVLVDDFAALTKLLSYKKNSKTDHRGSYLEEMLLTCRRKNEQRKVKKIGEIRGK